MNVGDNLNGAKKLTLPHFNNDVKSIMYGGVFYLCPFARGPGLVHR